VPSYRYKVNTIATVAANPQKGGGGACGAPASAVVLLTPAIGFAVAAQACAASLRVYSMNLPRAV